MSEPQKTFCNFFFFRVDPAWRRESVDRREAAIEEFVGALRSFEPEVKTRSYLTMGFRHDADLLIWAYGPNPAAFQDLNAAIYGTGFGKQLELTTCYFSMTRPTTYARSHAQAFQTDMDPLRYVMVYPFTKKREWYSLSQETRQEMMNEHISIGKEFPSVRLSTTYCFGLDDFEFILAFETDKPDDFLELVLKLRSAKVSQYTLVDIPLFVGVWREPAEAARMIGGTVTSKVGQTS
ncbi:MAG: chlorite dismutase family protein [Planctomycetota bacterium]|nr:chlorite dismutase family protein [Planctomycetota bacterium]